jgi:hypothetical protein
MAPSEIRAGSELLLVLRRQTTRSDRNAYHHYMFDNGPYQSERSQGGAGMMCRSEPRQTNCRDIPTIGSAQCLAPIFMVARTAICRDHVARYPHKWSESRSHSYSHYPIVQDLNGLALMWIDVGDQSTRHATRGAAAASVAQACSSGHRFALWACCRRRSHRARGLRAKVTHQRITRRTVQR